jgi:hypothetical protein
MYWPPLPDRLLCKQLVWSGLGVQTRPDQTIPITARMGSRQRNVSSITEHASYITTPSDINHCSILQC